MWFVQRQNVSAFAEEFHVEIDPAKREVLRQLLLAELERCGLHSAQLEMANSHLRNGQDRISRRRELIERLRADGSDAGNDEPVLDSLLTLQRLFTDFRNRVLEALNESRL